MQNILEGSKGEAQYYTWFWYDPVAQARQAGLLLGKLNPEHVPLSAVPRVHCEANTQALQTRLELGLGRAISYSVKKQGSNSLHCVCPACQ